MELLEKALAAVEPLRATALRLSRTPRDLATWDQVVRGFLKDDQVQGLDEVAWRRIIQAMAEARRQFRGPQAEGWLPEDWRRAQELLALAALQVP